MATRNTNNSVTSKKTTKKTPTTNRAATKNAAAKTINSSDAMASASSKKASAKREVAAKTVGARKTKQTASALLATSPGTTKSAAKKAAASKTNKIAPARKGSKKAAANNDKKITTASNGRKKATAPNDKRASITSKLSKFSIKNHPVPACVITGIVCVLVGLLIGFYLLGSGFTMIGRTSIPESELDNPVGLYIINGVPNFITAREVLDSGNGLSNSLQDDGTYAYPTAEEVLAAVRTAVLNGEVTARGIAISADDMKEYAQKQLGTSDYEEIAKYYGLDEASVQTFIRQAVGINKLRQQITGVADQVAPTAPTQGLDAASYKQYILDLLGDNWDAQNNTWTNEDNSYYTALGGDAFNPDLATYEQASVAYGIASQNYQADSTDAANTWNDFVNDALKNCQVRIGEAIL